MEKVLLGLTGQSGAGKSTVGKIFSKYGALVIDCDRVARVVVEPGKPALAEIREAFGENVINPDGTMNRQSVASIVFHDENALHKLNRITHKYIEEEITKIVETAKERVIVIDAPVLFESGIDKKCRRTICVLAEKETRIKRIMARDGLSREKALARINAQHEDGFYREKCDDILENNGDDKALEPAVLRILKEVLD